MSHVSPSVSCSAGSPQPPRPPESTPPPAPQPAGDSPRGLVELPVHPRSGHCTLAAAHALVFYARSSLTGPGRGGASQPRLCAARVPPMAMRRTHKPSPPNPTGPSNRSAPVPLLIPLRRMQARPRAMDESPRRFNQGGVAAGQSSHASSCTNASRRGRSSGGTSAASTARAP